MPESEITHLLVMLPGRLVTLVANVGNPQSVILSPGT